METATNPSALSATSAVRFAFGQQFDHVTPAATATNTRVTRRIEDLRMFRRLLVISIAAISTGLALCPATARAQLDTLQLRGQPVAKKGIVKEITKEKVTLEINGVSQSFDVNQIVRLNFDAEPNELNNARNAIAQRKYDVAAGELKKLDGKPQKDRDVAADIAFYKAYCQAKLALTAGGDKAAASAKMLDWAKANANNFHFYESAELLGDLAVASGQSADATRYYGTLSAAPWPDYQLKGNIAVGKALMAEKKFAEALDKFEAVATSSDSCARSHCPKAAGHGRQGGLPGRNGQGRRGNCPAPGDHQGQQPRGGQGPVRSHLQRPGQLLPQAEQDQRSPPGVPVHRYPVRCRCRRSCRVALSPQQAVGRRQQDRAGDAGQGNPEGSLRRQRLGK